MSAGYQVSGVRGRFKRPDRGDLARHMERRRAGLPPAGVSESPGRFDPFEGRHVEVVPGSMRPGIDRLRTIAPKYVHGTYFGPFRGRCALLPDGPIGAKGLLILVDPSRVREEQLLASSVDFDRWREGYNDGVSAYDDGLILGGRSMGRVPDDYGRGFALGFTKAKERRLCWWIENEWNEFCRQLALRYPDEHWVGKPSAGGSPS